MSHGPAMVEADGVPLAEWLVEGTAEVNRLLAERGAVRLRGFGVTDPDDFRLAAGVIVGDLYTHNTEHVPVSGDGAVQRPVPYPPARKLLWHNENCFNATWPLRIVFCCAQPAERGGETPLVDGRTMREELDPAVVDRFSTRGVQYVRRYRAGVGLPWERVFGTSDRADVAARCTADGVAFDWLPDGSLETRATRPALIEHPASGELSWFNQLTHWHPRCLDAESRAAMLSMWPDGALPRECLFGDGDPIPDDVVDHVLDTYQAVETTFPWEAGDVLVVDNVLNAHGRNPFTGERRLLVAMGAMQRFAATAAASGRGSSA